MPLAMSSMQNTPAESDVLQTRAGGHANLPGQPLARRCTTDTLNATMTVFNVCTDERYWNQIGPHGGWLSFQLLGAIRRAEGGSLLPRSFTAEFIDRVTPGEFEVQVQVVRRQKSITFVHAALMQSGRLCVQSNVVLAERRSEEETQFESAPWLHPAESHPPLAALELLAAFPSMFDYRVASGWPGRPGSDAVTAGFLRPREERIVTPEILVMLADAWFPAVWASGNRTPATTVSMSVVFTSAAAATTLGPDDYLLATFRTSSVAGGFGDETGSLWWPEGRLAAKVQQLVRFGTGSAARA